MTTPGLLKYAACQKVGFIKTAEMEKEGAIFTVPLLLSLLAAGGVAWGAHDTYKGVKKMYETGGKDGKMDTAFGALGMIPAGGWLAKGTNWARKAAPLGRLGQGLGSMWKLPNIANLGTRIGQGMQHVSKAGQGLINSNRWNKYVAPIANPVFTSGGRFQTGLNAMKNNWSKVKGFGRNLNTNIPAAIGNAPQFLGRQLQAFNPIAGHLGNKFGPAANAATQRWWTGAIVGDKAMGGHLTQPSNSDLMGGGGSTTNPYLPQQTDEKPSNEWNQPSTGGSSSNNAYDGSR